MTFKPSTAPQRARHNDGHMLGSPKLPHRLACNGPPHIYISPASSRPTWFDIATTPDLQARSLDDIKEFLRLDTAVFPDSVQTVKLMVAEGDLVATWATYEGTQQGPMGPFPPSGRKAQFDFGAVFRIEDGKIAEWWVTWDNMTILRAL